MLCLRILFEHADVDRREIVVGRVAAVELLIAGDGCERIAAAEIVVDLAADGPCLARKAARVVERARIGVAVRIRITEAGGRSLRQCDAETVSVLSRAGDHRTAARDGTRLVPVREQVDRQGFVRFKPQLEAPGERIVGEKIGSDRVLHIAVVLVFHERQARRDAFRDRSADGTLEAELIIAAVGDIHVPVEFIARLGGDDVDETARRVAAEERALRSLQNLDAADVEQLLHAGAARRLIDFIDVEGVRRFDVASEIVLRNAADRDETGNRRAAGRNELQTRRHRGKIGRVAQAKLEQAITAVRRNGDADILHVRSAASRGDDDFLDRVVAAGCGILRRGAACGKRDRKRENTGARVEAAGPFHDSGTSPEKPVAPHGGRHLASRHASCPACGTPAYNGKHSWGVWHESREYPALSLQPVF